MKSINPELFNLFVEVGEILRSEESKAHNDPPQGCETFFHLSVSLVGDLTADIETVSSYPIDELIGNFPSGLDILS